MRRLSSLLPVAKEKNRTGKVVWGCQKGPMSLGGLEPLDWPFRALSPCFLCRRFRISKSAASTPCWPPWRGVIPSRRTQRVCGAQTDSWCVKTGGMACSEQREHENCFYFERCLVFHPTRCPLSAQALALLPEKCQDSSVQAGPGELLDMLVRCTSTHFCSQPQYVSKWGDPKNRQFSFGFSLNQPLTRVPSQKARTPY